MQRLKALVVFTVCAGLGLVVSGVLGEVLGAPWLLWGAVIVAFFAGLRYFAKPWNR